MFQFFGSLIIALFVFIAFLPSARAADHLDAPGATPPGGDTRLDINDVYAFQSPSNSDNVVFIVTVSPAAGVIGETTFHPQASYDIKVDTNGNAKENATFRITFSKPDDGGVQRVVLKWVPRKGNSFRLASGQTGQTIPVKGGGQLYAGLFDDPFFFDLDAFRGSNGRSFCDGDEVNFFLGLNTLAIVLELPRSTFPDDTIGIWARTLLESQIDRMGRPAINTVFIPKNPFEPNEASQKDRFNKTKPKLDQKRFRGEVEDTLALFYDSGDPTIDDLADVLLPDILTVDTSSSAGFLNGRRLADDVIDAELGLLTDGAVPSDCVNNDSSFSNSFPYLQSAN
jgi:Domain of unknown function (DUF4331)